MSFKISYVVENCEAFKIGKTSMKLKDRRNMEDYRDVYPNIASVFKSGNGALVSMAEADLIDTYINHPKCENVKDGEQSVNDQMGDSDTYQVYIVWR